VRKATQAQSNSPAHTHPNTHSDRTRNGTNT
jgi:predicted glutamine amidotransferase